MPSAQNHLIELPPRAQWLRLLAGCEPMELVFADVLCEPGERMRYVHSPVDGFHSLLTLNQAFPEYLASNHFCGSGLAGRFQALAKAFAGPPQVNAEAVVHRRCIYDFPPGGAVESLDRHAHNVTCSGEQAVEAAIATP